MILSHFIIAIELSSNGKRPLVKAGCANLKFVCVIFTPKSANMYSSPGTTGSRFCAQLSLEKRSKLVNGST